jgi:TPR repeat protein
VAQDYAEAAHWFREAAEQGEAKAQSMLGVLYALGQGVPQDYVQAHMWINIAASLATGAEQQQCIELRDGMTKELSPQEVVEAQRLAREWRPKKGADTGWKPMK